jgi:hypothetical protein
MKASWNVTSAFNWKASASASATREGPGGTSTSDVKWSSGSSSNKASNSKPRRGLPEYNVPPEAKKLEDRNDDGGEDDTSSSSRDSASDEDKKDSSREPSSKRTVPRDSDSEHGDPPQRNKGHNGPTVDSPFDFDTSESIEVVECTDSDLEDETPLIAIPQLKPKSTSPFLRGYPPSLQYHGISKDTWASFLETVSAFLEATVSDSAIQHAMDIAAEVSKRPKKLVTTLATRTTTIGQQIGNSARRGNLVGMVGGIVNGAVSIPLNLVLGTTTAVLGAPISAALAASKKSPTARQRATAYVAVANREWLVRRGLFAGIVDTKGLGELLGMPASALPVIEESDDKGGKSEETQYGVLEEYCEELETWGESKTQIGPETLWLVLTQVVDEEK